MDRRIGQKDNLGNTIKYIHAYGNEYTIYEIEDGEILWEATKEKIINDLANISLKTHKIQSLVIGDEKLSGLINHALVRAYSLCAEGKTEKAEEVFEEAERQIIIIKTLTGRFTYLFGCILTVLIIFTLLLIMFLFPNIQKEAQLLLLIIMCGSLGALLSVFTNLNRIDINIFASKRINTFAGFSRILLGMIGAIFIYLLVQANIIFGILNQSNSVYVILAISFAAGFSENLITNILKKFEEKQIF